MSCYLFLFSFTHTYLLLIKPQISIKYPSAVFMYLMKSFLELSDLLKSGHAALWVWCTAPVL